MALSTKDSDLLTIFSVELGDDGSPDYSRRYIRFPAPEKPYILRFKLTAGTLAANKGKLCTNYPADSNFNRTQFREIEFSRDHQNDKYADIIINFPGAFEYYVSYEALPESTTTSVPGTSSSPRRGDSGHFVVDPRLFVRPSPRALDSSQKIGGSKDKVMLPLGGLVIESIVAKWMGPISAWDGYFKGMSDLGYNMAHFVPIQKRGGSNSPYSIYDQLAFSDDLFDPSQKQLGKEEKTNLLHQELRRIEDVYGIMALSDVVWNHTSYDSEWLLEHPEAGYNLQNSPHLIPAYELDTALLDFSANLATKYNLPTNLKTTAELDAVINALKENVFKDIKLWEFYAIDVTSLLKKFKQHIVAHDPFDDTLYTKQSLGKLSLYEQAKLLSKDALQNRGLGFRYARTVDLTKAIPFVANVASISVADVKDISSENDPNLAKLADTLQHIADEINLPFYKQYDADVATIVDNIKNRVLYQRLADHGPKMGDINKEHPLVETYFTRLDPKHPKTQGHAKESLALANNGWIWNANPMLDFASAESFAYLRREVIVWGDCVKLRYGKGPDDNPWLWDHMKEYTEQTAMLFQGLRIDNCHSTPLHVAQYLLDAARKVRPDLYVVAELFTGSEEMDITFVSRLGINSLIREAMQAWDAAELSRLVHRHGGKPVGSMDVDCMVEEIDYTCGGKTEKALLVPILKGSGPHALFMDCTHDNETPHQKRRAEDTLSNAALVAFSACAVGSVKGYDEVYPELLDIVNETRHYEPHDKLVDVGIGKVKRVLQRLHTEMALDKFAETHVHHEEDYIIVHRQHPSTHEGYLLICHTAFPGRDSRRGKISPVKLRGTSAELCFSAALRIDSRENLNDKTTLRGLKCSLESLGSPSIRTLSDDQGSFTEIVVPPEFPSGSVMLLKTSLISNAEGAFDYVSKCDESVFKDVDLVDTNIILYRCGPEEQDTTPGNGTYNIPGYGDTVYCGLQGFMSVLNPIIENNDLGHPFCAHLRNGAWALDYTVARLDRHLSKLPHLQGPRDWLDSRFTEIKKLPNFLIPKYFALALRTIYQAARVHAVSLMTPLIRDGDRFVQSLALVSCQMYGPMGSTGLHPTEESPSMAAGLPHFTTGYMRCWGRDVMISLRGLLLVTDNFDGARRHLISFASTLKHGLIPNLLDAVRYPRYNSRDSAWWFLQAVQDYVKISPEGKDFLKVKVPRRFPKDDTFVEPQDGYKYSSSIEEIIQEIFERHAKGIHFREWNAGTKLDMQMSDKGFNIDIEVDWNSGLILGGNQWNCGTWMDKMGESEKAGNKGLPGTPRDGAPVEITGMVKSTLRWILELQKEGRFPWNSVQAVVNGTEKSVTYQEWDELLSKNFEKYYFVPKNPREDGNYKLELKYVSRRGMYKDTYGSTFGYTDYQLRPNFAVAMAVAPELFVLEHAWDALVLAKEVIAGPLGMRTLDPRDPEYRPYYDNSNDSDDKAVAKGRNYHQGPEWVWCMGYFLRAYFKFDILTNANTKEITHSIQTIQRILLAHKKEIEQNPWAGLPELTNLNGAPCWDSCPTQAWSASCLLDLIYDINQTLAKENRK